MSTQYRLVQSGKTASGGCSAGQGSSEPVAPRIYFNMSAMKQNGKRYNMDNTSNNSAVCRKKLKSSFEDAVLAVTSDIDRSECQKCILS
jgi:carbohydrate-binding DOMON domain-containing protein